MQEEEWLARDVYGVFYERWDMQVFKNIVNAEKMHMESVTVLIEHEGLDNSSETVIPGIFSHAELQALAIACLPCPPGQDVLHTPVR